MALTVGGEFEPGNGFKVVGAHTDSPVLKVKPVSNMEGSGYTQLGVECYGGGLWHTWLDRDLSLAGMLVVAKAGGGFERKLVHIKRPLMRIPSLCIHLQTAAEREKLELNKETHLVPIMAMINEELNKKKSDKSEAGAFTDRHTPALVEILAQEAGCAVEDIRDMDLSLYDTQSGAAWGTKNEFFSGARIDNQVRCALKECTLSEVITAIAVLWAAIMVGHSRLFTIPSAHMGPGNLSARFRLACCQALLELCHKITTLPLLLNKCRLSFSACPLRGDTWHTDCRTEAMQIRCNGIVAPVM